MEASIQAAEERLVSTNAELEKQKALNEKLENDLVHMDNHNMNGRGDGAVTPLESNPLDALAGIELGKKLSVGAERSSRSPPHFFDLGFPGPNYTYSLRIVCRYFHFAYCDKSTGSFQAT